MTKAALKHRLRHHHPRFLGTNNFLMLQWMLVGDRFANWQIKPRCTFASLGKDCPVIKHQPQANP